MDDWQPCITIPSNGSYVRASPDMRSPIAIFLEKLKKGLASSIDLCYNIFRA